jgi:hypothetical protein
MIETNSSEGYVIYFGVTKNTIIKSTVNKSYCQEYTLGKITIGKCTTFKFLKIDFFFIINKVFVFNI